MPSISAHPSLQLQHTDLELVIAECYFGAHSLTIASFYRPPSSSTDVMSKIHNVLSLLRPQNFSNLVICGDFIIDPTRPHNCHLQSLQEIQLDFNLTQVVNSPTRVVGSSSSTIDLILLSSVNYLNSCDVRSPIGLSDHASVLTLPSKKKRPRPPTKPVWIYKSANLPLAKELLSNLPV